MRVQTATYLLYTAAGDGPVPLYVGETLDPALRFQQHLRDAQDPHNPKQFYAYLREQGITDLRMEVVPGVSERALLAELRGMGHSIYNSNSGLGSTTKKARDLDKERRWREINHAGFLNTVGTPI